MSRSFIWLISRAIRTCNHALKALSALFRLRYRTFLLIRSGQKDPHEILHWIFVSTRNHLLTLPTLSLALILFDHVVSEGTLGRIRAEIGYLTFVYCLFFVFCSDPFPFDHGRQKINLILWHAHPPSSGVSLLTFFGAVTNFGKCSFIPLELPKHKWSLAWVFRYFTYNRKVPLARFPLLSICWCYPQLIIYLLLYPSASNRQVGGLLSLRSSLWCLTIGSLRFLRRESGETLYGWRS